MGSSTEDSVKLNYERVKTPREEWKIGSFYKVQLEHKGDGIRTLVGKETRDNKK